MPGTNPDVNKLGQDQVDYVPVARTFPVQKWNVTISGDELAAIAQCFLCRHFKDKELPLDWEAKCEKVGGPIRPGGLCGIWKDANSGIGFTGLNRK